MYENHKKRKMPSNRTSGRSIVRSGLLATLTILVLISSFLSPFESNYQIAEAAVDGQYLRPDDGRPIKFFDFSHNTIYESDTLNDGKNIARPTAFMRTVQTQWKAWFGPVRYPTLHRGHVGDGGTVKSENQSLNNIEGSDEEGPAIRNIRAYNFPYLYVWSPVDPDFARPNQPVHRSEYTSTFNIQLVSHFNESNVKAMFNGNPTYVLQEAQKHRILRNNSLVNTFYYIRDLAELSGADVENNASPINHTNLQVYQTDYPDIDNFNLKSVNSYKVGEKVGFNFYGYTYVSNDRTGRIRNNTDWQIKVISGPGTGQAIGSTIYSNTGIKNPTKPFMNRYAGRYTSEGRDIHMTPTQVGTYVVELTITDAVKRSATKRLQFTIGDDGGACNPNIEDCDTETCDPNEGECEPEIIDPGPPTIPPPDLSCAIQVNVNDTNNMSGEQTVANPRGEIIEDDKIADSAVFDVLKYGIPSSEYLKVKGESEKYLSDYNYRKMAGNATYNFKVTKDYMYRWEEESTGPNGNKVIEVKYEHIRNELPVTDPYNISYWLVGHFKVLGFMEAIFKNYALPNEEVSVVNNQRPSASGNHNPNQNAHVFPKNCEGVYVGVDNIDGKPPVGGPSENIGGHANLGSRPPDVKNDRTVVDGFVSMSDALVSLNGPTPRPVPIAPLVAVQKDTLQIDPLKVNKRDTSSSITSKYDTVFTINASNSSLNFTGYSPDKINTVTVHTPVVMYGEATDDKEHDQRVDAPIRSTPPDPDDDRHAIVLDRPFTVTLPKGGQHLDEPGYGNRDFEKYQAYKEIKFPFDVYTETKQGFYPKDEWIKVPEGMETVDLFLPVWVPEGEYEIKFRSIAINSPESIPEEQQEEQKANLNLEYRTPNEVMDKHIAVSTIKADVIGRLYDFRVTDILDFRWGPVFRTTEGLVEHTGNHYWVGDKMIDGDLRGNEEPFVLPVRHGSHPKSPEEMKNVAVKTGYQFKFDMKSKGNMWNNNDAVRITPSFHFVNKDGTDRRPVDVYYHDDANYFVKIGSDKDKEYRDVILNEPLRNVEEKQLFDTAEFMYRHPDEYGHRDAVDKVSKASFIRKFNRDYSKQKTRTGPYGWQMLNWNLRTLIGPEASDVPDGAMIPPEDAIAREQQWYGEYSLPAEVFVADKGRNIAGYGAEHRLTKKSPVFLQDGYIIVNFDIETIDNGDTNNPHLSYHKGTLANQWEKEGFKYSFIDPYGDHFDLIDGDVIFYHGDQSSYDDFDSNVTH